MNQSKQFSLRALTSVFITIGFLAIAFTGAILFITPPGRVANWTGWTILGLTKHQWGALHICFSIIFIVSSILHLIFNWRVLLSYFKSKATKSFAFRQEWLIAAVICAGIFIGTISEVPPFSTVVALNEDIKNSWDTAESRDPVPPHAELMTLTELAAEADMDVDVMIANLKAAGIDGGAPEVIVKDLAESAGITPRALYSKGIGKQSATGRGGQGQGRNGQGRMNQGGGAPIGWMTVAEVCKEKDLNIEEVLNRLKEEGIEADAESVMRDLAFDNGMRPPDLMSKIGLQH